MLNAQLHIKNLPASILVPAVPTSSTQSHITERLIRQEEKDGDHYKNSS